MYRQGQLLNVRGEKTSEKLFYDAFHEGFQTTLPDCNLVDYCCAEQLATIGEGITSSSKCLFLCGEFLRWFVAMDL